MKRNSLKTFVVFSVLASFLLVSIPALAHYGDEGEYQELTEISATVSFKRPGGFFLTTESEDDYKLMMGPVWHLENIGLELKSGDTISVNGYKVDEGVIFVTSVKKNMKTYDIADEEAFGLWCEGPGRGMWGYRHMPHHRKGYHGGYYGRRGGGPRGGYGGGPCW
jgi:hypothetical protein